MIRTTILFTLAFIACSLSNSVLAAEDDFIFSGGDIKEVCDGHPVGSRHFVKGGTITIIRVTERDPATGNLETNYKFDNPRMTGDPRWKDLKMKFRGTEKYPGPPPDTCSEDGMPMHMDENFIEEKYEHLYGSYKIHDDVEHELLVYRYQEGGEWKTYIRYAKKGGTIHGGHLHSIP